MTGRPENDVPHAPLGRACGLHILAGCLDKGKNIKGFIEKGFVDPSLLLHRHDQPVKEMKRRRYNHCSPIVNFPQNPGKGHIDSEANRVELCRRCEECRNMINADIKKP